VGIVGFGGNGRRLAEVLAPYRCRILATDAFPREKPEHVEAIWPAERLPDLLAAVNIVILCVPLNASTRGMMGQREFAHMRPGSIVINVARGPVIAERELIAALEANHLWGAGVDVTEVEPLAEKSRLWELPNVIITPHVGAQSARRADDTTDFLCENLRRFLMHEPLMNVVDKQLGFPQYPAPWRPQR
jgi:D-3-phosphoglycerate dehydrogenase